MAALESAYHMKYGGTFLDLAEQQLVDCTYGYPYNNYGCGGGNMNQCFKYLQSYKVMPESSYPYTAVKGSSCKYTASKGLFNVKSYTNVASNNVAAHMTAVAQ